MIIPKWKFQALECNRILFGMLFINVILIQLSYADSTVDQTSERVSADIDLASRNSLTKVFEPLASDHSGGNDQTGSEYIYRIEGGGIHRQRLIYEPSKCSQNPNGMVYFAVGRRVFRQPATNLFDITARSQSDSIKALLPPSEPIGCIGNPFQQAVYHLSRFSAMPSDSKNKTSQHADMIGVKIKDGEYPAFTQDELFDLMSKNPNVIRDNNIPEWVGFRKSYACDRSAVYSATHYLTPDGGGFHCFVNLTNYVETRQSVVREAMDYIRI